MIINKYKTFSVLIYRLQLYQHEWELGKREIVWKHDARRAECFHTISSFPDFRVFPFFIKKQIFRVDIELYQHGS